MSDSPLIRCASQYVGTKYRWGGQDSLGMDCSGLVVKSLFHVGIVLPDMTAQGIYEWASKKEGFQLTHPCQDCLLFFGKNLNQITHVAIAADDEMMIEAGGSGRESLAQSDSDLARIDAMVRWKPITNRKDFLAAIKVEYKIKKLGDL